MMRPATSVNYSDLSSNESKSSENTSTTRIHIQAFRRPGDMYFRAAGSHNSWRIPRMLIVHGLTTATRIPLGHRWFLRGPSHGKSISRRASHPEMQGRVLLKWAHARSPPLVGGFRPDRLLGQHPRPCHMMWNSRAPKPSIGRQHGSEHRLRYSAAISWV